MNIQPLSDRVIVKRDEEEKKTASGIVIPDSATERPSQGVVLAVGTGRYNEQGGLLPMHVSVGDRILFGKYSGQAVKSGDQELLVMREEDILGIIRD